MPRCAKTVNVFSCHLSPSIQEAVGIARLDWLVVIDRQYDELADFVSNSAPSVAARLCSPETLTWE